MAGIYLHIPWCRKVCIYCDFHFSVSMRNKDELIKCMIREIGMQKDYLGPETVDTIYFGGGTPSVLNPDEINSIIDRVKSVFVISGDPEISIEVNPDDLSLPYLRELNQAGINRLSIGIQSFNDYDLEWMNRRHNGIQALRCIEDSREAGFENISIDLIYGLPEMDTEKWKENLIKAFSSNIRHLSAYHLTLENKTVYSHKIKKGLMKEPDEIAGLAQFEILMDMAGERGFEHYEISNFSLPGYYSRHNTSYWLRKPYLGIGPSANSFDGHSRQWNIKSNSGYIKSINAGIIPFEHELLDTKTDYNEYILTSLRTIWGVDVRYIANKYGNLYHDHFMKEAAGLLEQEKLTKTGNKIKLSRKGKFFADGIMSQLFYVEG
jgi:putative oxygen-independent coproporphyrinogen III oxidase